MFNNILEISQRTSKGGRVPIKVALLTIHEDEKDTNKNGIHWDENYVRNAIDSVKMMPICAAFADEDKEIPLDHGLTGEEVDEDGVREPLFENSETVGSYESADIETITVNGNEIKALVGTGVLYAQRYPKLVDWVRRNYVLGQVSTSIEIMGLSTNDNKIIYDGEVTDEYRVPKEFVFSGCAILSIPPSDDNAIVIEVSQKRQNKEENKLGEEELKALIQTTISETNSRNDELTSQIAELNEQIVEKDNTISELNASVAQLQQALDDIRKEQETSWEEMRLLEQELVKAKVVERLNELDAAVGEFNEEEQAIAKDDIDALRENINACKSRDELNNMTSEINSIKSKICMEIVRKQKEAENASHVAEINSQKEKKETEVIDIFSEINQDADQDEEVNIF